LGSFTRRLSSLEIAVKWSGRDGLISPPTMTWAKAAPQDFSAFPRQVEALLQSPRRHQRLHTRMDWTLPARFAASQLGLSRPTLWRWTKPTMRHGQPRDHRTTLVLLETLYSHPFS